MPDDAILISEPALVHQPPATLSERLEVAIHRARDALLKHQHPEGYWCFEFEADCTIPAEYILMMHYLDEIDAALQAKLAAYLRARQVAEGGWPLYYRGKLDLSCTVKVYYALKLAGDDPGDPHMVRAREAILARGGAARANVFTRIALALFGQIPWRGVPFMPVEIVLLPRWFPFHLSKVSYWSRTVMVPLLVLCSLKARAKNPHGIQVRELFTEPPEDEKQYFPIRSRLNWFFLALDQAGRSIEPFIPRRIRHRAIAKAEAWFTQRIGSGGLGGIFPAMVNAYHALDLLGYSPDHPLRASAKQALQDLLVVGERAAYCQPCVSPVWDTVLACLALQETEGQGHPAVHRGLDWLVNCQLLDAPGDWREYRPDLPGGGWPFQFENSYYPDLDDTAVVVWSMGQEQNQRYRESTRRAAEWLHGMQSKNGGFASFDADNTHYYLNEIPFADHGALLDPPTADVSARCATALARLLRERPDYRQALDACLAYLRREQEPDGCWFGRWGTNYIYGTWSVLAAFEQVGIAPQDPAVRRAVEWLTRVQRSDGGWGEDNASYEDPATAGRGHASTSFQTAWAMLGLMAAGEGHSTAVRRGAEYLLASQRPDGLWQDEWYTAPGFPRVFYLKYHGYDKYFPLWALARYRKLLNGGAE